MSNTLLYALTALFLLTIPYTLLKLHGIVDDPWGWVTLPVWLGWPFVIFLYLLFKDDENFRH